MAEMRLITIVAAVAVAIVVAGIAAGTTFAPETTAWVIADYAVSGIAAVAVFVAFDRSDTDLF